MLYSTLPTAFADEKTTNQKPLIFRRKNDKLTQPYKIATP